MGCFTFRTGENPLVYAEGELCTSTISSSSSSSIDRNWSDWFVWCDWIYEFEKRLAINLGWAVACVWRKNSLLLRKFWLVNVLSKSESSTSAHSWVCELAFYIWSWSWESNDVSMIVTNLINKWKVKTKTTNTPLPTRAGPLSDTGDSSQSTKQRGSLTTSNRNMRTRSQESRRGDWPMAKLTSRLSLGS